MFKTLLVDDNDVFRQALRTVLSRHFPFMQIDEAATGAAVFRTQSDHQLVFMDIRLPDTNGLELTRRLKALHPGSLVCVITQFDIPEYREAAKESGASEFILKDNLNEGVVVRLVDSMLATRSSVLIVVDDPEFRDRLCHLFEDCWPEVDVTAVGWLEVPALPQNLAQTRRPDMVVMEPQADRDGFERLDSVTAEYDSAALVVVASADRPEYREWALHPGAHWVVFKDARVFDELQLSIPAQLQRSKAAACQSNSSWSKGRSSRKRR